MGQRDSLGTLYINERPKHYFCYMYTPCMYMYTVKRHRVEPVLSTIACFGRKNTSPLDKRRIARASNRALWGKRGGYSSLFVFSRDSFFW